jgi:hypothetical protein
MDKIFKASLESGADSFEGMSIPELDEAEEVIRNRMAGIVFHSSDTNASTFDEIQDFNLHRIIQVASAKKRKNEEMKDADK